MKVKLSSNPPGATVLDTRVVTSGEDVKNTYGPLQAESEVSMRAGHHVMRARYPDRVDQVFEFDAKGGNAPPIVFTFPEPTSDAPVIVQAPVLERPVPATAYVAGALTIALGIGTSVTGILAVGAKDDFAGANDGTLPEHADFLRDRAKTLNTVTDVLLAGTIVAGATTLLIYLTRPTRERPPAAAAMQVFSAKGLRF